MTRHAARDNGFGYWMTLTWNTATYYAGQRRWTALCRALWLVVGRGYYLEVCEVCGRRVEVVWHATDDLYQTVTEAGRGGVFCTACFDHLAESKIPGAYLVWRPELIWKAS